MDLTEAQTAASALRAYGVPVLVQNEHWGHSQFHMQMAMGGFRLWTPAEDAAEAKAFIGECRGADRDALVWSGQRGAITGLPLTALSMLAMLFGGALTGWVVASARHRPSVARVCFALALIVLMLGLWWLVLMMVMTGPPEP